MKKFQEPTPGQHNKYHQPACLPKDKAKISHDPTICSIRQEAFPLLFQLDLSKLDVEMATIPKMAY